MRLYRTNPIAVLTMVAGGAIGGFLTLGSLLLSRSGRMAVERTHERARERIEPLETVPYRRVRET